MPRQLTRLSAWAGFRRSLRPAAANHTVCSESRPGLHHRNPARSLILQHIDARLSAGDSSVSRKREAAIVGARRTGFAGDRVDVVRVDVSSPRSHSGRWLHMDSGFTRSLQPRVSDGGRRESWRLDFRGLSSKTAGGIARDGCKQGPAVYSVRS